MEKSSKLQKKQKSFCPQEKECLLWHHAFKIHPSKSKQQIAEEIISSSSSQSVNQWHSPFRKYPSLKEHFKPSTSNFFWWYFSILFPAQIDQFSHQCLKNSVTTYKCKNHHWVGFYNSLKILPLLFQSTDVAFICMHFSWVNRRSK